MRAPPKINTIKFANILQEIRNLIPYYTPEWLVADDNTPDSALLKIFAHMITGTLEQLNQVPEKNFIAFLDILGVQLLPAQQSRVPVTFYLSQGTVKTILIPAKTSVSAQSAQGGDSINFETERNILATPAQLVDAYSFKKMEDSVFSIPPYFLAKGRLNPVSTKLISNVREGDTSLFLENTLEIKPGDILEFQKFSNNEYVEVDNISGKKVTLKDKLINSYRTINTRVEKVINFELFTGKNKQEHILYLGHLDIFNITASVRVTLEISNAPEQLVNSEFVQWEYWGESQETKILGWYSFDDYEIVDNNITFIKNNNDEIKEKEVNKVKSRWIRCVIIDSTESESLEINKLDTIEIDTIKVTATPLEISDTTAGVPLNKAFYNDVPIDASQEFYPFGKQPRQLDTFYFANQEAFSKKGVTLTLQFQIKQPEEDHSNEIQDPILSWEYWNGSSWDKIIFQGDVSQGETDATIINLTQQDGSFVELSFICPEDIEKTTINGELQYWLRVRLINGTYGREVVQINSENNENITEYRFNAPLLEDFTITYVPEASLLDYCLTFNNLQYQDKTEESKTTDITFKPFESLEVLHQSLYLGFDAPPLKGPISIFFSLEIQAYTKKNRPQLNWEYYSRRQGKGEWVPLEVQDLTNGLTRSGTVEFIGSSDFAQISRFGQLLYWIRVVDVEDKFKPEKKINSNKNNRQDNAVNFAPAPKIKGIDLNTTWASQIETINNEILGSSDGRADQTFTFSKSPVISEELWVNEFNALSSEEQKNLSRQRKIRVREVKDNRGDIQEFWVRWEPKQELLESDQNDRHYQVDRTFGQIKFGNGTQGAIPPIGANNIIANYQLGGGTKGNIGRFEINALKSSIAYVDSVTNPEPGEGGTDTELLEKALQRGPQILKHRNRAVTVSDFEYLTRQASRSISRVKCLPNFNDQGNYELGWVTLIVVPNSSELQPKPSLLLRQQVERYLQKHTANVVTSPKHLRVSGPIYFEVVIETVLIADDIEAISNVKLRAMEILNAFLHPLTGGYSNQGWEFGRLPCLSDFYALLGSIPGLDRVESLITNITDDEVNLPAYTLVSSGQHLISVKAKNISESNISEFTVN
ncbi:putative baseplate assembly protein [Mastigocoleus testarum]|uniref:Uncharacterized protein n=1 Tax=Mastigocoleus testarum BC008 TaxID=371196 RepID=A0A0V7ZJL3_9CYAN|nr:putative baseplate assembly protein [Mastigocoleus testarum]KST62195.1 hypothetical protein BC008_37765 [Mastigocoleus testarum BC008]KST64825.1 hypothetical protein BC008_18595 [Mastigocoleus testarum BC008]